VAPPRIDLANEELVRAHIHAIWLAETGQSLYSSVSELLDLTDPGLPVRTEVRAYIDDRRFQLTARTRAERVLTWLGDELTAARAPWFTPEWLDHTISAAPLSLDHAADRWRNLYNTARQQQERQHEIIRNPLRRAEHKIAEQLREEAESQVKLLIEPQSDVSSDFYSYRYFATEGFLPGYNFPRLPVTAYIPGRLRGKGADEFLSRARFIAISEFGPRAILYHEGNRYRVSRVVLPAEDGGRRTRSAHFCNICGYGHFGDRLGADCCDNCGARLDGANGSRHDNLLRLDSVSTYRVDRISCNEEERLRLGYDVRTTYRFGTRDDGSKVIREIAFDLDGKTIAHGVYGPATTIWRVNQGWNRRKSDSPPGFVLDMEKGIWSKSDLEPSEATEDADPLERPAATQRVIPYVEDRKNAFVLELSERLEGAALLSLQYALKRGIEARYQLESSELAVETVPDEDHPRLILFYEASEGGAGVLVRLAEEPGALAAVAREALAVCHFDPANGDDLRRAAGSPEDCEAACYDCLLSYSNQRHHRQLDRQLTKGALLALRDASGIVGASGRSRVDQRDALLRTCGSDLERDFLLWLDEHGLRLPDDAQKAIAGTVARPDFVYEGDEMACVYVDGAPHHFAERQERDRSIRLSLENLGWTIVRVAGPETWAEAAQGFPWVFGPLRD
ncbi:MAG TPA: DUF1998 domain-containing protein, partial [Chloroflexota bacterium]|nr:DUF1998 domain-containing protein [Chloroflexota bacterium]